MQVAFFMGYRVIQVMLCLVQLAGCTAMLQALQENDFAVNLLKLVRLHMQVA